MPTQFHNTSANIPEGIWKAARRRSFAEGLSISSIVSRLLMLYALGDIEVENTNARLILPKGSTDAEILAFMGNLKVRTADGRPVSGTAVKEEREAHEFFIQEAKE